MGEPDKQVDRRAVLRTFGVGAAVAGVAVVGAPGLARPAAADDDDPLLIGRLNVAQTETELRTSGHVDTLVVDNLGSPGGVAVNAFSRTDHGVMGVSEGASGVFGLSTAVGGAGVTGKGGTGATGVRAFASGGDGVTASASAANKGAVRATATDVATAVIARAAGGYGIDASSTTNHGVVGKASSPDTAAVRGMATGGAAGVHATATDGPGVESRSTQGVGGTFEGATAAVRLVPQTAVGAPTSGFHQRGELLMDGDGALFVCKTDGTPGAWKKVKLVDA